MADHAMHQVFVTGGSGFVGRNLLRRLRQERCSVAALARSESAANTVARLGATPARGDLSDVDLLAQSMAGCDTVFHAAALVDEWGPQRRFEEVNVGGTAILLEAARRAGVACVVHEGTEAMFADGHASLENLDETRAVPRRPLPRYPATKAYAEKLVLEASSEALRCVSLRPRLIWGKDDSSLLPKFVQAVHHGRFRWIDQGRALTSTTHVDNVAEGLLLAARHGRGGQAYFISDGAPISYREFLSRLLETAGVAAPQSSVPLALANAYARTMEGLWESLNLRSTPPATRLLIELLGKPVTVIHAKATQELGYAPVVSREQGLSALGSCQG
jgi:nucleoside-diphosphate-sugar epimerase